MNAAFDTVVADLSFREKRRKYLGGSDIAALLGIAPEGWRRNSPLSLYFDKTMPPAPDRSNLREKRRGKVWEGVVAEMLVDDLKAKGHTVEIVTGNVRYLDPDFDFFASEIDYEIRLDGEQDITNVELKTVHPFASKDWGESESDDMPIWYTAQCMWGLGVTRRKRCILAPLFGADEIRTFTVDAVPQLINDMRDTARKFWVQNVLAGVPPAPGNLVDLKLLFPKDNGGLIELEGDALIEAVAELRAADELYDQAKLRWESAEKTIKQAMGENAVATLNKKPVCSWKRQSQRQIDGTALREAHPKLAEEFTKINEFRKFLLSRSKK